MHSQREDHQKVVVVGTDGSGSAHEALVWAADYACATGARLRAVHAWDVPVVSAFGASYAAVPAMPIEMPDASALEEQLRHRIDEVLGELGYTDLEVEVVNAQGDAARVLLDQGHKADLVVVGRRGLGGLAATVLGSVSRYVSEHSDTPVVVVPHAH